LNRNLNNCLYDSQGTILVASCAICHVPIFFAWNDRKRLVCNNCGTIYRLTYNNGRLALAIVVSTLNPVVVCRVCEEVFEVELEIKKFKCPKCRVTYYNTKVDLARKINKRLETVGIIAES